MDEKILIIKEALLIVDKLGKFDGKDITYDEIEEIEKLIKKAKRLVDKNDWKLI